MNRIKIDKSAVKVLLIIQRRSQHFRYNFFLQTNRSITEKE